MLDFYQKRKLRAVLNSRITQGVLGVMALLMIWNAVERYSIATVMEDRRVLAEKEATTLQVRKDSLEGEVEYLRDERGIEAQMRRQFDIALPGEEVVVILEDESMVEIQPLATTTEESSGWWLW
jgi:cell division protein FtsB